MNKLLFYVAFIFLLLYLTIDIVVWNEDGSTRPFVQLVAGLSLLFMVLYNLFYVKRLKKIFYRWSFLLYWGFFTLLIIGYYGLSLVNLPTYYAVSQVRNVLVALFIFNAILFIYNATISERLKNKTFWFLIVLLIVNALFDLGQAVINPRIRPGGFEEINTSSGYVFVMILPLLMYLFRKNYKWIFAVTLLLTLISGKRGALVIFVMLILYSIFQYRYISSESKLNWKSLVLAGLFILGVLFFVENAYESFQYRIVTIEKDSGTIGSGRNFIWSTLLTLWADSTIILKVVGSGFYATVGYMNFIAHNDFVQYLIDYGLLGLSLWCFTLLKFYLDVKHVKYYDRYMYLLLIFCILIIIGRGLFAGTIRTDQIYLSISMGYLLGVHDLKMNSKCAE